MRIIEPIQLDNGNITIVPTPKEFVKEKGLDPDSPDDMIIAGCIKVREKGESVVFISEDRGARITARNAKIEVLNFYS
ncbi:PIN domain-containing protein [Priestia filamentosa]|uniref:PIN domain-containing protein n=1 Tax=Priestia filamentosa TaxID=1402861 RepID=UPI00398238F0